MRDGDLTAPIVTEFLGKDAGASPQQTALRGGGTASDPRADTGTNARPPLHRLHEERLVRSAGHMAIGAIMPAPDGAGSWSAGETAVFSSRDVARAGWSGPGAAVALACAVALGGAGLMVHGLTGNEPSPPRRQAERDEPVGATASVAATTSAQMLAVSPAMLGERQETAPARDFVRVTQKDTPGLIAANVFGPAGTPIRLPVALNGGRAEDYSFLMFRGLPANVTLSAGFRLKESWAVSLRDIDNLFMETPAQFQGSFTLEILLIKGRDTPAESRMITVEVAPSAPQIPPSAARQQAVPGPQVLTAAPRTIEPVERAAPAERQAAAPVGRTAPAGGQSGALSPQQEQMLMGRATALLGNKDIMSARLVLEHLAMNGSAGGALALAKTFDPSYLQSMAIGGIKPDIAKARQWYRRAADLGETEASARLNALASR